MKSSMPKELEKSCSLCEYSRLIETTGQTVCVRSKNARITQPDSKCGKFRFDILSYRPLPLKIPKFTEGAKGDF